MEILKYMGKSKNSYLVGIFIIGLMLFILLDLLVLEKILNFYWISIFLICVIVLRLYHYIIIIYKFKKKLIGEEDIINKLLGKDTKTQEYWIKILDYLTIFPRKQNFSNSVTEDKDIKEEIVKNLIFQSSWKMTLLIKIFVLILIFAIVYFAIISFQILEMHRFFIMCTFISFIVLFFPHLLSLLLLSNIEVKYEGIYVKNFTKTLFITWSDIEKVGQTKTLGYPKIGWIKLKNKISKKKYILFLLEKFAIDTIGGNPIWRWRLREEEIIKFMKMKIVVRKQEGQSSGNNR